MPGNQLRQAAARFVAERIPATAVGRYQQPALPQKADVAIAFHLFGCADMTPGIVQAVVNTFEGTV